MADLCGAKTRSGTPCKRPAGSGTDHVGYGACKNHGGSMPSHQVAAARAQGAALAVLIGGEIDLDPLEALLQTLRASAGAEAFYRQQVQNLKTEELHSTVGGTEHGDGREEPHLWIRMYAEERDRLARTAKLCLDAGVQERQVKLAESFGETIAAMFAIVLEGLGLSPAQQAMAPDLVRRALGQLELGRGT